MASEKLPLMEPIGAYGQGNGPFGAHAEPYPFKKRLPWHQSPRFRIFIATTLICASLGLIFSFSRPAVFSSFAVLLTVTPDRVGAEIVDPSLQHALIQKNLLGARATLEATLKQLQAENYAPEQLPGNGGEFQKMLTIKPLEATNLLEISAEGHVAEILPVLLNTLIANYSQSRSEAIEQAVAATNNVLLEQQHSMAQQVASKREALETFRANNNILSLGRDENEVFAKLNGLTQALSAAFEKRVTSKAKLEALQAAAAQGKALIPPNEQQAFSSLQQRQRKLQNKLNELDNKYTRDYMALHPDMKAIPEQLAAIKKTLVEKAAAGKSFVLSSASRDYQAAKIAESALQQQLEDYKQTALTFSNRFASHESMKEALLQLEEHALKIQQRITELHVGQQQKYPQIDVIEPAYLSNKAIRPYYWRDATYIVSVSLLLGLIAIWLYEFLRRPPTLDPAQPSAPNYVTILDPRLTATGAAAMPQAQLVNPGAAPSLAQTTEASSSIEELENSTLLALLTAANLPTQQLIALLLSGLRPDELAIISSAHFAPTQQVSNPQIILNTANPRALPIPLALQQLLAKSQGSPQWLNNNAVTDDAYFNAMLRCAAIDAGLQKHADIDCSSLHQSYIFFLVRSGIKLSELHQIVGLLPPLQLSQYGQLSPSGPGLSAGDIELVHPALQQFSAIKKGAQYH